MAGDYHDRHRQTYGHSNPNEPVQVVTLRLSAIGRLDELALTERVATGGSLGDALRGRRDVWFEGAGLIDCALYDRARLPGDASLSGPAILEAADTTVVVPPGWRIDCDPRGFLVMEVSING